MIDNPCPFHLALITAANGCVNAVAITRRSGPDIACGSSEAQQRCKDVFDYIKHVTQPELGFPDNLQDAPHSTNVRLQNGGLLGLQNLIEPGAQSAGNVAALVEHLHQKFRTTEGIPAEPLIAVVRDFKSSRRSSRRPT